MTKNNIRTFKEVAKVISRYAENPEVFMKEMKKIDKKNEKKEKK